MKKILLHSTLIKCILLLGLAILPFGCEDDPSTETDASEYFDANTYESAITDSDSSSSSSSAIIVSIVADDDDSESTETVTHVGQTISFRASGGSGGYTWSLGESSVGTIAATHDDDSLATYTATEVSDNTVIATDSHGKSGTAELLSGSALTLAIVPASETLTSDDLESLHGTQVQFTGYGGTPPYTDWTVSSTDLGTIDENGLYTVNGRIGYGDNTISVRDAAGNYATATMTTSTGS